MTNRENILATIVSVLESILSGTTRLIPYVTATEICSVNTDNIPFPCAFVYFQNQNRQTA